MAITHQDILDWVNLSDTSESSETELRVIAGRAYYAAYHAVDQIYLADKSRFPDSGSHAKLINTLKASDSKDDRRIGFVMQACKDIRVKADYLIDEAFTAEELTEAIKYTTNILTLLPDKKRSASAAS